MCVSASLLIQTSRCSTIEQDAESDHCACEEEGAHVHPLWGPESAAVMTTAQNAFVTEPTKMTHRGVAPKRLAIIPDTAPKKHTIAITANKRLLLKRSQPQFSYVNGAIIVSMADIWMFVWKAINKHSHAPFRVSR